MFFREFPLSGQSLSKITAVLEPGSAVLGGLVARLAQPAHVRRIRQALIGLSLVWLVMACSQLIWGLFPAADVKLPANTVVLNPAQTPVSDRQSESIDVNEMLSWHLLGMPQELNGPDIVTLVEVESADDRDGIEQGARETQLDLRLRGIVASTVDGMGHAIIEHKSRQQVYAVDDKLPISGRVILAKVMPDRVVIDNRGTYELIILFEDTPLSSQVAATAVGKSASTASESRAVDKRDDLQTTVLAQGYRQQLYQNPQSLAELVRISAVRENGALLGYKIAPGSDVAQFTQLGFIKGDLVTSVNGVPLTDPGNTVRLYQLMRSAQEAVFELQRGDATFTVSVNLGDPGADQ
jgi:general secretion pathway protein C